MTMSRFAGGSFCDSCGRPATVPIDRIEINKIDSMKTRAKILRAVRGWECSEVADGYLLTCPSCLGEREIVETAEEPVEGPVEETEDAPVLKPCTNEDVARVIAEGNDTYVAIAEALEAEGFDIGTDGRLSLRLFRLKKKGVIVGERIPGTRFNMWRMKRWQDR